MMMRPLSELSLTQDALRWQLERTQDALKQLQTELLLARHVLQQPVLTYAQAAAAARAKAATYGELGAHGLLSLAEEWEAS